MVLLDDFLFLVVLVIPGFIVVSVGRYLSGVAESSYQIEYTRSVLLWSFVANAAVVLTLPFAIGDAVNNLDMLRQALFDFDTGVIAVWLAMPLIIGCVYALGLIVRIPHLLQRKFQSTIRRKISPHSSMFINTADFPWRNFFRLHRYVVVSTLARNDQGQEVERAYSGQVLESSSSRENREIRLHQPYVRVDGESVPIYEDPDEEGVADEHSEILIPGERITKIVAVPPKHYPDLAEDD